MNEMSIEDSEGMMEEMDIVKHISEEETIKKKLESLYELIDKISSLAAKRSVVKNNWIATGVIPYIEEKYSDCNLSVSMIADKFGMHPVYTSRVFKEQTGTGLFEYISKYRIDQSKSILLNTNYTLENVAMQVGYASSRAFARMFKKTEGITPGQFRSAHQKHEDI